MAIKRTTKSTSSTGLTKEVAAALSYVLGPITGVVFLLLEKDPFVRFHAMQSILVFGGLFVVQTIMAATIVLAALTPLLSLLGFVVWLVAIYKAWQGEKWEVPVVGQYVNQFLGKV
jgi:uncharacterized membrane protein